MEQLGLDAAAYDTHSIRRTKATHRMVDKTLASDVVVAPLYRASRADAKDASPLRGPGCSKAVRASPPIPRCSRHLSLVQKNKSVSR